jgi:peptidoglycan hydrolase CwlO-like protein
MKNNITNILLIVVLILLIYIILSHKNIRTDITKYNTKIDSIGNHIDSMINTNKNINGRVLKLDTQINEINTDISDVQKNIIIIKKQTDEKINNVDNYNFSDLNNFFTDRYDSTIKNGDRQVSY